MSILDYFRTKSKNKNLTQDKEKDTDFRRDLHKEEQLENQAELEKIALSDTRWKIRQKAAEKLQNQDLLKEIARNDKKQGVKITAVSNINDQAFLEDIARNETIANVRFAALRMLQDDSKKMEITEEIIKNSDHEYTLRLAINLTTDFNILSDLIENNENESIIRAANKRLAVIRPGHTVLKIDIKCPFCNQPVFINGPLRKMKCHFCTSEIDLNLDFWSKILKVASYVSAFNYYMDTFHTICYDGKFLSEEMIPRCLECGKGLDSDSIQPGDDKYINCSSCAHKNATFPPPQWMNEIKGLGSIAQQIYCGEREGEDDIRTASGLKPVVTTCVQCGSNLTITAETPRNATCSYCDTTQYLPDPLWLSLHPMKIKKPWFIRWQAKGDIKKIKLRELLQ